MPMPKLLQITPKEFDEKLRYLAGDKELFRRYVDATFSGDGRLVGVKKE